MEHREIDDQHILDRYLAGRLGEDEEARFEEHLFACSACLEQVEAGEALRRGLRAAAAEDAARAAVSLGLLAWLRGRPPLQRWALAALVALAAALPAWVLVQRAEVQSLRAQLAAGQHPAGTGLAAPLADLLVISLGTVRDATEATEVRLPEGKEAVLLSLELPLGAMAESYRATLRRDAREGQGTPGAPLWRGEGLEPSLYGTLVVLLPAAMLQPGGYRVALEARAGGGFEAAGEMRFRVPPP